MDFLSAGMEDWEGDASARKTRLAAQFAEWRKSQQVVPDEELGTMEVDETVDLDGDDREAALASLRATVASPEAAEPVAATGGSAGAGSPAPRARATIPVGLARGLGLAVRGGGVLRKGKKRG